MLVIVAAKYVVRNDLSENRIINYLGIFPDVGYDDHK